MQIKFGPTYLKGQLISKYLFGIFNSPKKNRPNYVLTKAGTLPSGTLPFSNLDR